MPNSSFQATVCEACTTERTTAGDEVRNRVRRLLDSRFVLSNQEERRRSARHPFPYLIKLLPVGKDGMTPVGKPLVVIGKQLSSRGIDFYHQDPIEFRHAIVSLQTRGGKWLSFLVELTWCRFTGYGWYDNGGRFLQVVDLE